MNLPNHSSLPDLATWPVLYTIIGLLLGALALEVALSSHWTDPFREMETWVLIGVVTGVALRVAGRWLTRRGRRGEDTLRWLSLAVWTVTAMGGLIGLLL